MTKKLGHAGVTPHIPFRLRALCSQNEIVAWENQTEGRTPADPKVQKILASLRRAVSDEHRVAHGTREGGAMKLMNWKGEEGFQDIEDAVLSCIPSIRLSLGGQVRFDELVITPHYVVAAYKRVGDVRSLYISDDSQQEVEIEVLGENLKSIGEALEWAARYDNLREYVTPIIDEIVNCNLLS